MAAHISYQGRLDKKKKNYKQTAQAYSQDQEVVRFWSAHLVLDICSRAALQMVLQLQKE